VRKLMTLVLLGAALSTAGGAHGFVWPNTAERIEKQLKDPDVVQRRKAAQQLGDLPASMARRLVLQALVDGDEEVRLTAADVAMDLRLSAGEHVVAWLADPERRLRLAAAELLRVSPAPRAVPALGRVLSDPDPAVRSAAASALGASGEKDAVMPLLGHLDDSLPQVRRAVVLALARLGDARAVVPLIGKIQDAHPTVRHAVARALGELGDVRAVSALMLALRDNEESVRIAALEALGALRDGPAVLAVTALLGEDQRPAVRAAALETLARIGTPDALDALIGELGREDADSGSSAVRDALTALGKQAVPRLARCLVGQPPARLGDGCALALADAGSEKDAVTIVDALRRGAVRPRAALAALAKLGDPKTIPTVLEHLADPDPFVRRSAIDAAAALLDPKRPDGRAVEPIAKALDRPETSVLERAALARLLGRTGSPRAVSALGPIADAADDVELRLAAIDGLGMLGAAGQDRVLLSALDDEDASVRLAAAVALRRSASGAAARVLLDRLGRAAEQDRAALALALGGALERSKSSDDAARAERLMRASHAGERDALIEALGRVAGEGGSKRLLSLATSSAEIADRAKIAEALGSHPEAREGLAKLALDVDGSVRANAIWSLGSIGGAGQIPVLERALADRDVAVAGNAAAALGRVGKRSGGKVVPALCKAAADSRSYVRANALAGLALANARCAGGEERAILARDPAPIARRAAARLIARVTSKAAQLDRAALAACAAEDPDGSVASSCAERSRSGAPGTEAVVVYVVPIGEGSPAPRTPFALRRPDGVLRLGVSDRRGVVFEHDAPRGELSLDVPAPLAR
jgi:cellulose synthase operon protein C